MRRTWWKAAIIGVLFALLGGCSAVRLSYHNGPQLAWWWLDGYVDFSSEATPRARQAIDRWFDWHRSTQLPDYAAFLATLQPQVLAPVTPQQVCRWQDQARDKLAPAIDRAAQLGADLVPTLGEAQFRHIEKTYAKKNDEARNEYLQPRPDDRRKASMKRALERFEMLYGTLDEPQRRVIAAGIVASPFDAELWLAERSRRQQDLLQTLRRLVAERADRDTIVAALRAIGERWESSADPAYRSYAQRLEDYNCAFAAQVHNATTPAQRQVARDKLKGWEEDARALAAGPG